MIVVTRVPFECRIWGILDQSTVCLRCASPYVCILGRHNFRRDRLLVDRPCVPACLHHHLYIILETLFTSFLSILLTDMVEYSQRAMFFYSNLKQADYIILLL